MPTVYCSDETVVSQPLIDQRFRNRYQQRRIRSGPDGYPVGIQRIVDISANGTDVDKLNARLACLDHMLPLHMATDTPGIDLPVLEWHTTKGDK